MKNFFCAATLLWKRLGALCRVATLCACAVVCMALPLPAGAVGTVATDTAAAAPVAPATEATHTASVTPPAPTADAAAPVPTAPAAAAADAPFSASTADSPASTAAVATNAAAADEVAATDTAAADEVAPAAEGVLPLTADTAVDAASAAATAAASTAVATAMLDTEASVYIVPIQGEINRTQLFILRRALKEALRNGVDTVVLDMNTPGGQLGVTLEMMEALQRFPGKTITYVNTEAVSAGSFISMATDAIWFAPGGIMGAAEAVSGGGQDIAESMQRKIRSYLSAKVRSLDSDSRYRADVQRAMMDPTFVLEIDGVVLSKEGELLSLTAAEAAQTYGEPPEPLLSSGTAATVDALLDSALGVGSYTIRQYELTWSETFAKWFQTFAPLLMGVGIMLLFIEFKTPGFGVLGGVGIALLLLVFASNYFAGLAGYEVLLIFLLGVCLLAVEVLVLPGMLIAGAAGILLILGSLLWAMADVWPKGAEGFTFSADLFARPLFNLGLGLMIAVAGAVLIAKLLPRTRVGRSLILSASVGGVDPLVAGGGHRSVEFGAGGSRSVGEAASASAPADPLGNERSSAASAGASGTDALPAIGAQGTAVTPLRPSGQVEIDGRRYEARLLLGQVGKGATIEVIGYRDFALLVKGS